MPIRAGSGGLKYALPSQGDISARQGAAAASAGGSASASAFGANRRYAGLKKTLQHNRQQAYLDRGFRAQQDQNSMRFRADAQLEGQDFRDKAQLKGQTFSAGQQTLREKASAEQGQLVRDAQKRAKTTAGLRSGDYELPGWLQKKIDKHDALLEFYDGMDDEGKEKYDIEKKRLDDLKYKTARRRKRPIVDHFNPDTGEFGDKGDATIPWMDGRRMELPDSAEVIAAQKQAEQKQTDRDFKDKRTTFWHGKVVDGTPLTLQEARAKSEEELRDQQRNRPGYSTPGAQQGGADNRPASSFYSGGGANTGDPKSIQADPIAIEKPEDVAGIEPGGEFVPPDGNPQDPKIAPPEGNEWDKTAGPYGKGGWVPKVDQTAGGGGAEPNSAESYLEFMENYEGDQSDFNSLIDEKIATGSVVAPEDVDWGSDSRPNSQPSSAAQFEKRAAEANRRNAPRRRARILDPSDDERTAFKDKQILADWKVRLQRGLRPTKEQQEVLDRRNKKMRYSSKDKQTNEDKLRKRRQVRSTRKRRAADAAEDRPDNLKRAAEKKKWIADAKKMRADFKSKTNKEKAAIRKQRAADKKKEIADFEKFTEGEGRSPGSGFF